MADARYVIDLILNAKNDTARAFAEAIGDAKGFEQAMKDQEAQVGQSTQRIEGHLGRLSKSQKQLRDDTVSATGTIARELHVLQNNLSQTALKMDQMRVKEREALFELEKIAQKEGDAWKRNAGIHLQTFNQRLAAYNQEKKAIGELAGEMEKWSLRERELRAMFSRDERPNQIENQIVAVQRLTERLAKLNASEKASLQERRNASKELEAATRDLQILMSKGQTLSEALNDTEARRNSQAVRDTNLRIAQERELNALRDQIEKRSQRASQMVNVDAIIREREEIRKIGQAMERLGLETQAVEAIIHSTFQAINLEQFTRAQREAIEAEEDHARAVAKTREQYNQTVGAVAKLKRQREQFREQGFADEDIDIAIGINEGQAAAKLEAAVAALQALDPSIELDVEFDVDGAVAALAQVAAMQAALRGAMDDGRPMGFWRTLQDSIEQSGNRISTFDNQLRGAFTLAIGVSIQPIATALAGLAGQFFAVGSSAVMAGAAIGGAMSSAASQAVPAIGVMGLGIARLQGIFDVINQQGLVDEQMFHRAKDDGQAVADTTDQVANAQDGLRSAYEGMQDAQERVREAREGLNEAYREGTRDLEDLILAEREAELAARGAALTQAEAQERYRRALSEGRTGDFARADLGVDEANFAATRAEVRLRRAREDLRRGGNPRVEAAKDALREAREGVEDAERGIDRARRGLQNAQRGTAAAGEESFAAASKLEYLRQQLSETERDVLDTFTRIYRMYQDRNGPIRGISDAMLEGFNEIGQGIIKLLRNNEFTDALTELSGQIGDSLAQLFDAMADNPDQLIEFIENSTRSVKIFGDAMVNVYDFLEMVADISAPLFEDMLKGFRSWTDELAHGEGARADTKSFLETARTHLSAWWDLAGAVGGLFGALAGEGGGAASGLRTLEAFTATVNRGSDWVRQHADDVQQFFRDTERITASIGRLILGIGAGIIEIMDVGTVEAFTELMLDVFIPALVGAFDAVGTIIKAFNDLTNLPLIGWLIEGGAQFVIFGGLVATLGMKLMTALSPFTTALGYILRMLGAERIGGALMRLGGSDHTRPVKALGDVFGSVADKVKSVVNWVGNLIGRIPGLKRVGAAMSGWGGFGRGGGGGAPDAPGGTTVLPAGYTRNRDGTVRAPDGTILPAPPGSPGARPQGTRTQRNVSRAGRGIGVGALLATLGTGGGQRALSEAPGSGDFSEVSANISNIGSALFSLDLEGMTRQFGRFFEGLFGGNDEMKEFASTFEDSFRRMVASRNTEGLQELADRADELTKKYPEFADALKEAGDAAREAADGVAAQNRKLGETEDIARRLARRGLNLDINARLNFDTKDMSDLEFRLRRLQSGVLRDIGEVRNEITKNGEIIARNLGASTDEGKTAMARNLRAGVQAVKKLIDEEVITAKQGKREIQKLRGDISLLEGNDPLGTGKKFAQEIQKGKGNRQEAIQSIIRQMMQMPDGARQQAGLTAIEISRELERKGKIPKGTAKRLASDLGLAFVDMRTRGEKATVRLINNVSGWFKDLNTNMKGALDWVGDSVGDALSTLGGEAVKFAIKDPPGALSKAINAVTDAIGLQGGGFVGNQGERGRDSFAHTVHGRPVGRGEAVLTAAHQRYVAPAVQAFYGHSFGDTFKRVRGTHAGEYGYGYAGGYAGMTPYGKMVAIPGMPGEFIAQKIVRQVVAVMRRFKMAVTDGFATSGHAADGDHPKGLGVDFVPGAGGNWDLVDAANRWASARLGSVFRWIGYDGVPNHGRGHHLHLSWLADPAGIKGMMADKLKKMEFTGSGKLHEVGNLALAQIRQTANKKLEKLAMSAGPTSAHPTGAGEPAPPGVVRDWLTKALKITGLFSQPNLSALYGRAMQESGGNPRAINLWDSNAAAGIPSKGLLQTIDPTFQSYKMDKYPNIWNPVHNAIAAIRYMMARYGHIVGPSSTGYFDGGRTPGVEGQPFPTLLHGNEHVITAKEVSNAPGGHNFFYALRRMLGGGGQGGDGGYAAGGRTLMIGDSLTVGMREALEKMFKEMGQKIDIVAKGGMGSGWGLDQLEERMKGMHRRVIWSMGANDGDFATFKSGLQKAFRQAGSRELLVPLLRGDIADREQKNDYLRRFASRHDNVRVVRPEGAMANDNIHYTSEGYETFAGKIAGSSKKDPKAEYPEFEMPTFTPEGFRGLLGVIKDWGKNLKKIKDRTHEAFEAMNKEFTKLTAEGGLLDLLRASIDTAVTNRETARMRQQVDQRRSRRVGGRRGVQQYRLQETPVRDARESVIDADKLIDDLNAFGKTIDRSQEKLAARMFRVRKAIQEAKHRIDELQSGKVTDEDRKAIEEERKNIETYKEDITVFRGQKRNLKDRAQQNARDLAEAILNAAQKQTELVAAEIDKRSKKFDVKMSWLDLVRSELEKFGNTTGAVSVMRQQLSALRGRARYLENQIADAIKNGRDELAAQLSAELITVYGQISEAVTEITQVFLDAFAKFFDLLYTGLDLRDRASSAYQRMTGDDVGAARQQVGTQRDRIATLQWERQGVQATLAHAAANPTLYTAAQIEALTARLAELNVSIEENNAQLLELNNQMFQAIVAVATEQQGTGQGLFGSAMQIAQGVAQMAGSQTTAQMKIIAAQQQAFLAQMAQVLVQQLQGALGAGALGGNAGAQNVMAQLIQAFQQGPEEFASMLANLAPTIAQIMAGMDPATAATFQEMINALIENMSATIENTQQLEELNGGQELQGFQSSAWSMFREAIFNGLGGLLPEYQIPQMHTGGLVTKSGVFDLEVGERVVKPDQYLEAGAQTNNIYVQQTVEEAIPEIIARKVAWTGRMRGRQ